MRYIRADSLLVLRGFGSEPIFRLAGWHDHRRGASCFCGLDERGSISHVSRLSLLCHPFGGDESHRQKESPRPAQIALAAAASGLSLQSAAVVMAGWCVQQAELLP